MAPTPEILRAVQRDEIFEKKLKEDLSQIVLHNLGLRNWIRLRSFLEPGSKLLYRSLTTLGNLLTLGEEYTGIIQWTARGNLPSKQMQTIMVLFECFGEQFLTSLTDNLEKHLKNLPEDHQMRPEARQSLLECCHHFKILLPILIKVHHTVFYYQGKYYNISKRLTGIQYKAHRFWIKEKSVMPLFTILAIISALHMLATKFSLLTRFSDAPKEIVRKNVKSSPFKCSLCLNPRTNTSCTPCGHLFCWDCILPWVSEQPICPLCRQAVEPSRVVYLRNYSG